MLTLPYNRSRSSQGYDLYILGVSTGVRTFGLRIPYRSSDPNFSIRTFAKNQNAQYLGKFLLLYDKNMQYLVEKMVNKVFNIYFSKHVVTKVTV